MKAISDNIKPILALLILAFAFIYFFTVLIIEGHANDQVIIAVVAMVSGATGYYFGSSTGTAKNVETISTLAQKNAG